MTAPLKLNLSISAHLRCMGMGVGSHLVVRLTEHNCTDEWWWRGHDGPECATTCHYVRSFDSPS